MPTIVCRAVLLDDEAAVYAARVALTPALAGKLLGYRPLLAPLAAHDPAFQGVEFDSDAGEWGEADPEPDGGEWFALPAGADEPDGWVPTDVDGPRLVVDRDGVFFVGTVADSAQAVESVLITWDALAAVAAGEDPFPAFDGDGTEVDDEDDDDAGNE